MPTGSAGPGASHPPPEGWGHARYRCDTPCRLSLQSQSLSRSYGSSLPTSLTYIDLSTRDSKPWRPAADSVQAVESLRAPVFDFHGPRGEYRHSNLIPCSTSASNHISLRKTSMVSGDCKTEKKTLPVPPVGFSKKRIHVAMIARRYDPPGGTERARQTYTQQAPEL